MQYFNRLFDVEGDEAFVPRNETNQLGFFTLQQYAAGPFRAEGGLRYERSDLTARTAADDLRFFRGTARFDALSGSLGASYEVATDVRIGLNGSRTERAPSAEELFAQRPACGHPGL